MEPPEGRRTLAAPAQGLHAALPQLVKQATRVEHLNPMTARLGGSVRCLRASSERVGDGIRHQARELEHRSLGGDSLVVPYVVGDEVVDPGGSLDLGAPTRVEAVGRWREPALLDGLDD